MPGGTQLQREQQVEHALMHTFRLPALLHRNKHADVQSVFIYFCCSHYIYFIITHTYIIIAPHRKTSLPTFEKTKCEDLPHSHFLIPHHHHHHHHHILIKNCIYTYKQRHMYIVHTSCIHTIMHTHTQLHLDHNEFQSWRVTYLKVQQE